MVWGLGFGSCSSIFMGFEVWGFGFMFSDLGFEVCGFSGLGFGV